MRALVYLRNSSDKQAKAATIRAQRPDCAALAATVGADAVIEYADEGISGDAPLAVRAALHRLLSDCQPGDVVIAFAQDRLSRTDDMIEHAAVFGVFQRRGVLVSTVQEGTIDVRDQVGRLRAQLQSDAAASEKRKILARTAAGKRDAAARGQKPQGATPYGLTYDRATKRWGVDGVRAGVRREIVEAVAGGETCTRIAARLTVRGDAPTPRGRSTDWTARMVWHVATGRVGIGEWTFSGKTIAVPATVPAETWQRAQAALLTAGRRGLRRTQHVYLLDEGTGRCGCGRAVQIRWGGSRSETSYYVCPARCGVRWRRTADADAEVWARIIAALRRPDLVERAIEGERDAAADAERGEGDAAGFEAQIERLAGVEAAILRQFTAGRLTEAGMERELDTVVRQRALLASSAAAAREAGERARAAASAVQGLQEAARAWARGMERADGALRRETIRALRPDVRLGERIAVSFRLRAPSVVGLAAPIAIVHGTCWRTESLCDRSATDGRTVELQIAA